MLASKGRILKMLLKSVVPIYDTSKDTKPIAQRGSFPWSVGTTDTSVHTSATHAARLQKYLGSLIFKVQNIDFLS